MYESHERNGVQSWVRNDLKNRQKEYCMCWDCSLFKPDQADKGCLKIKKVLDLAQENQQVLPVWECPDFILK